MSTVEIVTIRTDCTGVSIDTRETVIKAFIASRTHEVISRETCLADSSGRT